MTIDNTRLRALVATGHTIADIARTLNVSVSALNWHIRSDVILQDTLHRIRRYREPERPATPWADQGACVGTTIDMFPSDPRDVRAAKRLCARCPVIEPCRAYAVEWEPFGVWGGMDEKERRQARRQRKEKAA